ncbi:hypothetical protein EVAR_69521_1 [Eumeta japonica]|uniref:Uncharacterized protein n=1 Tax=Eumeta variegata TaxID=151549 RepID=A0A4C2A044_EUMVA|nr:hypothetical protein EVAR_69521_1 [Eumeta japonica]
MNRGCGRTGALISVITHHIESVKSRPIEAGVPPNSDQHSGRLVLEVEDLSQPQKEYRNVLLENEFNRGRSMFTDEFKKGRSKSVVVPQNIDAMRKLIMQDNHVTYCEIKTSLGISDQPWIYAYDPETKQQSTVWAYQDEPNPTSDSCKKHIEANGFFCIKMDIWYLTNATSAIEVVERQEAGAGARDRGAALQGRIALHHHLLN